LPRSPEFETWVTLERGSWERQYLDLLVALVEEQMRRGNYQAAIGYARRYLAVDDLAEEMHRRLMTLYAAIGDRSAAMRQFELCAVALERDLSVSPLPETRAVYRAILEGQPAVLLGRATLPAWTTLPSLEVPLIGRGEALDCLGRAYRSASSGQGRFVLISGEAGIGKTRLMQDFVASLADCPTVVAGGGHDGEQGLPVWPLVEALRPLLPEIGCTIARIDPAYCAELTRLWPELRSFLPEAPFSPDVQREQDHGRLFQALTCWFADLAVQRPPLVLCLDDLHWMDKMTLCWLIYLARRLEHEPLLMVGTYRTEEAAAMATLRGEIGRLGCLQQVRLRGLSQKEVLCLIGHLSDQRSRAEQLGPDLHRLTGGNPFFLLEILREMCEAGILGQDEASWSGGIHAAIEDCRDLPLPDTICDAIRLRLGRLSAQAHQVLEAGAVIGPRFRFAQVWAVSGRRQVEVVEALEELVARRMIAERDGAYRFNHELFRRVAHAGLSYGRRRMLQNRLETVSLEPRAVLCPHCHGRLGDPKI
jgi:hypothetical protein